MAIHDDIEGIEVTICMNGEPMPEYDAEAEQSTNPSPIVSLNEDMCTVSKYIEAVTDQNFSVKFKISPEYTATSHHLGFEVLLDGVRVWEPLIDRMKFEMFPYSTMVHGAISGERGGNGSLRKFKFSEIETGTTLLPSTIQRRLGADESRIKLRQFQRCKQATGTDEPGWRDHSESPSL